MDDYLYWKGEPILYQRDKGHGLILGGYHYQMNLDGSLESVQRVTQPVLAMILGKIYPHPAQAMAAHARRLSSMNKAEAPPDDTET